MSHFAAGTFTPRTRGRIHNWDQDIDTSFEIKGNGTVDLSIVANEGDHIGLTIDARGVDDKGTATFSRPTYILNDSVDLERRRAFLTEGTRARNLEIWHWNGVPLSDSALVFPWGSIALDASARQLHIRVEANIPDTPVFHTIEVETTDVFGRGARDRLLVGTPTHAVSADPIASERPRMNDPRMPLVDPLYRSSPAIATRDRLALHATLTQALRLLDRMR